MNSQKVVWYQRSSLISVTYEERKWKEAAAFPYAAMLLTMPEFMQECSMNQRSINDVVFNGTFANSVDYRECADLLNKLPQLRRLAFFNTQVMRFTLNPMILFGITHLSITGCNCYSMPVFLPHLGMRLKSLDLSNNFLSELPLQPSSARFTLEQLFLQKNRFTSTPAAISHMIGLQHLDLSANNLTSLESLIPLRKLISLNVSSNTGLKAIPKEVIIMPSLTILNVTDDRALTYPPYNVAKNGLVAMRTYISNKSKPASWLLRKSKAVA